MLINNTKVTISPRMRVLAEMCIEGKPVADIGTDHGFVPIHLLAENMTPYVILSDVNEGPLNMAKNNLESVGINPIYYCLRLGSGLEPIENAEVSSAVIAGMGGELIEDILDFNPEKSHSIEHFVLQPRTHANDLRYYLSTHGFEICGYRLVKEKGRICEVFSTKNNPDAKTDSSLISDFLLAQNDALIGDFVDYKLNMARTVLCNLNNSSSAESEDMKNIWNDIFKELTEIRNNL